MVIRFGACKRSQSLFVVSLFALVVRETGIANPLINFRTLADRNYRMCCIIIFCAFGVLYANTTTLPGMLQSLFGYDATTSGLVLSPAGVSRSSCCSSSAHFYARCRCPLSDGRRSYNARGRKFLDVANEPRHQPVAGRLAAGRVDRRIIDDFAPLNVAAFRHIPKELRGAAVGLLALLRNEGGSVGTSVGKIILDRREQFHTLRLNESLDPLNPALTPYLQEGRTFFMQQNGDASPPGN